MLIHTYGLFWKRENVFWGRPKREGNLLGSASTARAPHKKSIINFRYQKGVYALYDVDFQLVYVGQSGSGTRSLFGRLRSHRKDHLQERWSMFSWFGVRAVDKAQLSDIPTNIKAKFPVGLDQMEALVLAVTNPPKNLQGGRFGQAVRYFQYRDMDSLGPSQSEMIEELYRKMRKK